MTDFSNWVDEELKPLMYEKAAELFPSLKFERYSKGWRSPYKVNGEEPKMKRKDKTVIVSSYPFFAQEQGEEPVELITLYQRLEHLPEDRVATIKRIAEKLNIEPPVDKEGAEKWKAKQARQEALQASAQRQQEALYSEEGKAVLSYLRETRGYSDEFIKWAKFGYISEDEANTLGKLTEYKDSEGTIKQGVGSYITRDYPLSIPYTYRGKIQGFKFRAITKEAEARGKYRNTGGLTKGSLLFGLTGERIKGDEAKENNLIIVEGELDCLRLRYSGYNAGATTGGALTKDNLASAKKAGVKRVILLLDNDKAGESFIKDSVASARAQGIKVLVAQLEGAKDVDEYLRSNSVESLDTTIKKARGGGYMLSYKLIESFMDNHREGYGDIEEMELRDSVIEIANTYSNDEVEREAIFSDYGKAFTEISASAIRKVADKARAQRIRERQKSDTKGLLEKAMELSSNGDTEEALRLLEAEAQKIHRLSHRSEFSTLLQYNSRESFINAVKRQPEPLDTSYYFYRDMTTEKDKPLQLTLPTGAITIIAGGTSHGKSTFLRNLALDVAKRYKDREGSILYFTFEESEEEVIAQFVNSYQAEILHYNSKGHSQLETIKNYYRTGETTFIGHERIEGFKAKERELFRDYLQTGKLIIKYKDYDITTLLEALSFISEEIKVQAIFIDYIQLLKKTGYRLSRAEELKEINLRLKDFAVETNIPIILASQLNREALTPMRMTNQNLAESSDIEKASNTIICLWRSKFKPPFGGKAISPKSPEQDEIDKLESEGFTMGKDGKIFAKITKRRGGEVELYSIFDFRGEAGLIVPNEPKTEEELKAEAEAEKWANPAMRYIPEEEENPELPF